MNPTDPAAITDDDLHAFTDDALAPLRRAEVEAWLAAHPDDAARVAAWREQKRALRALFDPVLEEPIPPRLLRAAAPRRPAARRWPQALAAGLALLVAGGAAGWMARGWSGGEGVLLAGPPARGGGVAGGVTGVAPATDLAVSAIPATPAARAELAADFPRRAAVAHAVYSPEQRRPVEVDAAHEDQLVQWLSKRMGSRMHAPVLQSLGFALEGGRLLPGRDRPVAQFMYRDGEGRRLTLYVSNSMGAVAGGDTTFRIAREGAVSVFWWVDGDFGYAISGEVPDAVLGAGAAESWRQLAAADARNGAGAGAHAGAGADPENAGGGQPAEAGAAAGRKAPR
ncbi:anti-sigma factor family protein [Derxia gummosa]|uniref:Anti-sigma factor family protein n=1 Tax=Derxia gummosa DSM 723 TaxID=1121388 RepID=A0A9U5GW56_9BURK|nr:anti-sigma factor [Derxia gummosa]